MATNLKNQEKTSIRLTILRIKELSIKNFWNRRLNSVSRFSWRKKWNYKNGKQMRQKLFPFALSGNRPVTMILENARKQKEEWEIYGHGADRLHAHRSRFNQKNLKFKACTSSNLSWYMWFQSYQNSNRHFSAIKVLFWRISASWDSKDLTESFSAPKQLSTFFSTVKNFIRAAKFHEICLKIAISNLWKNFSRNSGKN